MQIILTVILAIVKNLVPVLIKNGQAREDAQRRPELRARLRKKLRSYKRGRGLAIVWLTLIFFFAGCGDRVVYVPYGEPTQLAETVRKVQVWTVDADGKPIRGKMDLPEGWYALPDPGEGE